MEFGKILVKYGHIVDTEMSRFFDSRLKSIEDDFMRKNYSYLKEFVLRPGKRIRPISTIMAYKSINDNDEEKIYPISISPELFHTSSLIHDDIMDEDLLRRNKPTIHRIFEDYFKRNFKDMKYGGYLFDSYSKRFSVSMAIIGGNILYSLASTCVLESAMDFNLKLKALKIANNSFFSTNEGQIFDVIMSSNKKSDEEDYVNMVLGKTAASIASSIVLGALLNGATDLQIKNLEKYGLCVGLTFQIHDDIMDISKDADKGRDLGRDLRKGNKTLIVMKALREGNEGQKKILLKVLGNNNPSDDEVEKAIEVIIETGSLEYASDFTRKKIKEAKEYLKKADLNSQGYKFFNKLADYVINRKV